MRFGVALGGGAARGLAHLGVLQVLRGAGIVPDVVTGTSFGALVGAAALAREWELDSLVDEVVAYVHGADFKRGQVHFLRRRSDIEQTGMLYSLRNLIKRGIYYGFTATRASFVAPAEFRASIGVVVPDRSIESLSAPFAAIAADVNSGEEVVLDRGSLRVAVQASCAIPGVMPPVDIGAGRTCIDGGWVDKVPVEPCRALGADFVLAVDVSDDLADTTDLTTGLNVILRGDAIKSHRLKTLQLSRADHVIEVPVSHVDWADFPRAAEIIGIGRLSAEKALPALLARLGEEATWRRRLRRRTDRTLRRLGLVDSRRPQILAVEAVATPSAAAPDDAR
jgi:NTE family protein